jgi:hypothetical protein
MTNRDKTWEEANIQRDLKKQMKDNVKKVKKLVNNPKIFSSQKDKD